MSNVPTVWILGAGFSRSLGGPLLVDLLSMRSRTIRTIEDESWGTDEDKNLVYLLFHVGARYPEGHLFDSAPPKTSGSRLWKDAEEFLAVVTNAADEEDSKTRRSSRAQLLAVWNQAIRIHRQLPLKCSCLDEVPFGFDAHAIAQGGTIAWSELRDVATLMIAKECDFFDEEDLASERATPYLDWAKTLTANDTIITFNYDRVVETVLGNEVFVPSPSQPLAPSELPMLLKLHGSVDTEWAKLKRKVSKEAVDVPVLGLPGDGKRRLRQNDLRPLWNAANEKILTASKIAGIGYSMPASDASAVEFLMSGIAGNQMNDLEVDIVLGNPEFEGTRIKNLLDGVVIGRMLNHASLLTELKEKVAEFERDKETLKTGTRAKAGHVRFGSRDDRDAAIQKTELATKSAEDVLRKMVLPLGSSEPQVRPMFAQDDLRLVASNAKQMEDQLRQQKDLEGQRRALRELVDEAQRGH